MRVEDAARYLSIGRSKTYQLLAEGALPSVRIGRSVRVPVAALERWIAKQADEETNREFAAAR
jgi:excisionase family DNA binding protein